MKRRVVVTGMGCVTPIGNSVEELSSGLYSGRIGVGRVTLFDPDRYPVKIAAEVRGWDLSSVDEDPARWRLCPRQTQFAIGAGLQAASRSDLGSSRIDRRRLGVYLGCGEPFEDFEAFSQAVHEAKADDADDSQPFVQQALRVFRPDAECEYEPDMPAIHLGGLLGVEGPVANCVSACVSSTQAIGESARMIRRGEVDVMLCGGAHSTIHPFGFTGFQRLSALSTRNDDPPAAVRPFDADRDGFVIGEGAAMFVIENLDHALRRGAEILGEIVGYGSAQDAFRITDAHPGGRGSVQAMRGALRDAGINPEDVDYINAHGTGTELNDKVETLAIKQAFGSQAYHIPVSSTKSMMGHATTACGAIELAVCLLSLQSGVVPPTMNHETPGPECDLDYVPRQAREVACRHVLTHNAAFGGQSAALIASRYDDRSRASVSVIRAA